MTLDAFRDLPDDSRLWLLATAEPLDAARRAALAADMDAILAAWRHKGVAYHGAWTLLEDRILAISEPTMTTAPSGCAIDGMLRKVHGLVAHLGLTLLDESQVLFRQDGGFLAVSRNDLGARLEDGTLHADTPLVDLTLFTLGDLRAGRLEKPLARTWIGRKYKVAASV
ncbi:MAG TPA: hypothetical protein VJ600_09750 [Holophagaceae bacterium]|nr:hypothetical protein [Holophagaceae bacterium]